MKVQKMKCGSHPSGPWFGEISNQMRCQMDSICGWELIDVSSALGSPIVVVTGGGLGICPADSHHTSPPPQTSTLQNTIRIDWQRLEEAKIKKYSFKKYNLEKYQFGKYNLKNQNLKSVGQ